MKTDGSFGSHGRRLKKRKQFLIEIAQRGVMDEQGLIDFRQTFKDGLIRRDHLALFDECTDDEDAHSDSVRAIEDAGCHQRSVFGEGVREALGEFERLEVITICDHLGFLGRGKLEAEVVRKAVGVTSSGKRSALRRTA